MIVAGGDCAVAEGHDRGWIVARRLGRRLQREQRERYGDRDGVLHKDLLRARGDGFGLSPYVDRRAARLDGAEKRLGNAARSRRLRDAALSAHLDLRQRHERINRLLHEEARPQVARWAESLSRKR